MIDFPSFKTWDHRREDVNMFCRVEYSSWETHTHTAFWRDKMSQVSDVNVTSYSGRLYRSLSQVFEKSCRENDASRRLSMISIIVHCSFPDLRWFLPSVRLMHLELKCWKGRKRCVSCREENELNQKKRIETVMGSHEAIMMMMKHRIIGNSSEVHSVFCLLLFHEKRAVAAVPTASGSCIRLKTRIQATTLETDRRRRSLCRASFLISSPSFQTPASWINDQLLLFHLHLHQAATATARMGIKNDLNLMSLFRFLSHTANPSFLLMMLRNVFPSWDGKPSCPEVQDHVSLCKITLCGSFPYHLLFLVMERMESGRVGTNNSILVPASLS